MEARSESWTCEAPPESGNRTSSSLTIPIGLGGSLALGWQKSRIHESSCVAPPAMLPPLPLGEVELQARERVKRMSVSRRKLRQRTPRAAATASDLADVNVSWADLVLQQAFIAVTSPSGRGRPLRAGRGCVTDNHDSQSLPCFMTAPSRPLPRPTSPAARER